MLGELPWLRHQHVISIFFFFFFAIFYQHLVQIGWSDTDKRLDSAQGVVVYIYVSFAEKQNALLANGVVDFGSYNDAKKVYIDP